MRPGIEAGTSRLPALSAELLCHSWGYPYWKQVIKEREPIYFNIILPSVKSYPNYVIIRDCLRMIKYSNFGCSHVKIYFRYNDSSEYIKKSVLPYSTSKINSSLEHFKKTVNGYITFKLLMYRCKKIYIQYRNNY